MTEEVKEPKSAEETATSESSAEEIQAKPEEKSQEKPAEEKKEIPKEETPPAEPEKVELTKEEHEALLKSKEVGETYKQENEKYRQAEKDSRLKNLTPAKSEVEEQPVEETTYPTDERDSIIEDYKSKKANVIHNISEDIKSLTDDQWNKIKNKVNGTLDGVLTNALSQNQRVAQGELEQEVRDLIDWAKGSDNTQQVEEARTEGAADALKAEAADIGTVSSPQQQTTAKGVTEQDKETSAQTDEYPDRFQVSPERAKEIRENKEEREKNW